MCARMCMCVHVHKWCVWCVWCRSLLLMCVWCVWCRSLLLTCVWCVCVCGVDHSCLCVCGVCCVCGNPVSHSSLSLLSPIADDFTCSVQSCQDKTTRLTEIILFMKTNDNQIQSLS